MATVRLVALLAVIAVVTASCGAVPPGRGAASGSRSDAASPTRVASSPAEPSPCIPTPVTQFPASSSSTRNLAIAKLHGSNATIVRDITDITHASTITTLDIPFGQNPGFARPQFINATEISYTTNPDGSQANALVRMPLSGAPKTVVAATCGQSWILTASWNPTGDSAAYLIDVGVGHPFDWRLQTNGTDRSLSSPAAWCYCSEGSEEAAVSLAFSPSGHFVSMVDGVAWGGSELQIRRIDGSLVADSKGSGSGVTMGVWSGDAFYFRDSGDVRVWRDGLITTLRAGLAWLRPKTSPAGGQVVFYTRATDGLARVSVIDTKTGAVRQLTDQARIAPVFLSSRYVWYQGERLCAAGDQCVLNHTVLTGKTYIYDLTTGSESESVLADVADVWPHGG